MSEAEGNTSLAAQVGEALLEAKIKLENELKDLRAVLERKGQWNKEEIDQLSNVIKGYEREKEIWEIKENEYKEQKNKDNLEIRQINHKNTSLEAQISQTGTENECLKKKLEDLERKIAEQKEEVKNSNELQKKNENEIIQLIIDKEKLESELRREKEKRRRDNEIWEKRRTEGMDWAGEELEFRDVYIGSLLAKIEELEREGVSERKLIEHEAENEESEFEYLGNSPFFAETSTLDEQLKGAELAETKEKLNKEKTKNQLLRNKLRTLRPQVAVPKPNQNPTNWKKSFARTALIGVGLITAELTNNYFSGPGVNPAVNQLSLNYQPNFIQNSTALWETYPLDSPLNTPPGWMSIESSKFQDLTQLNANLIKLERDRDHWKNKYQKADLKPNNLPLDWEIKLREHKNYSQRPNITLAEYNNLLNNQAPVELPANWKDQLAEKEDLKSQITELQNRPTQEAYNKLKNNQRPLDLPNNWKNELDRTKDLEKELSENQAKLLETQKRPTPEQLSQAVQAEKDKHQHLVNPATYRADWINPINLENEAKKKGMISLETYNQRPDLTLEKYNELLNNQRPIDLPPNWKSELVKLPKLEDKIKKQKEQISILKSRPDITLEEFTKYKSPEQVAEIQKLVREEVQKEFKDYINPTNSTALTDHNLFTREQVEKTIQEQIQQKDQEWKEKGLINPFNPAELKQAKLVNQTDYDQAIQERNNRPNILLTDWESDWSKRPSNETYNNLEKERSELKKQILAEQKKHHQTNTDLSTSQKKVKIAEEFGLTNWDDLENQTGSETLTTLLARPTQKELADKQTELIQTNQQVNNLTTQLNKLNSDLLSVKESSRFEIARLASESKNYQKQRDLRPDITFTDLSALLTDKNNATSTIQELEKNLNSIQTEFEKYQTTTNQTIAKKDTKIKELQTDLTKWLDTFINQTALGVKLAQTELQNKLNAAQTSLENWTNTFNNETPDEIIQKLNQTKADLDNNSQAYNTLTQTNLDLEIKLSTKSAKVEQLNSLLDTLKHKYGQVRDKKDEAIRTREVAEKERDTATAERDTALLNLENLNQQLDDAQQELVRTQRENRKLTKKLNHSKIQQTKTEQQFQEQGSYLLNILECLASAGMGAKLAWKAGRNYEQGELQTKYLKDLQSGVNLLIEQRNQVQQERDYYRQQVESHRCGLTNSSCSHRPNYQPEQRDNKSTTSEQAIIQELNATLQLNLQNPNLKQVISKIQELIIKDPVVVQKGLGQVWQTIRKAEENLTNQIPFGEDLEVIKELELTSLEELFKQALNDTIRQQIQQATNYQAVVSARQAFLKQHLNQQLQTVPIQTENKKAITPRPSKERIVLLSLLVVSLVSVGGLLMKLAKIKKLNPRN